MEDIEAKALLCVEEDDDVRLVGVEPRPQLGTRSLVLPRRVVAGLLGAVAGAAALVPDRAQLGLVPNPGLQGQRGGRGQLFGEVAERTQLDSRTSRPSSIPRGPDPPCHTAERGEECFDEVSWAKAQGIFSNPAWYPGLTNQSLLGDFQALVHKSNPERCPSPCVGGNENEKSVCAPPKERDRYGSCNDATAPTKMTYYMYRAQGPDEYTPENINMADLAGVMWYLHREVVGSTPRKFHISRIIRYKVTMRNTQDYYDKYPKQFGPFVAFDEGSAKGRSDTWTKYGFVVGCQVLDASIFNYTPQADIQQECSPPDAPICNAGKWYSLPGPCPEEKVKDKTAACMEEWPGGRCPSAVVTGEHDCTYWTEYAGEISLDELEGIKNYDDFWVNRTPNGTLPNDNVEYNFTLDAGIGMDFWNDGHNRTACDERMTAVRNLFKKKYPQWPEIYPEPACN